MESRIAPYAVFWEYKLKSGVVLRDMTRMKMAYSSSLALWVEQQQLWNFPLPQILWGHGSQAIESCCRHILWPFESSNKNSGGIPIAQEQQLHKLQHQKHILCVYTLSLRPDAPKDLWLNLVLLCLVAENWQLCQGCLASQLPIVLHV